MHAIKGGYCKFDSPVHFAVSGFVHVPKPEPQSQLVPL